jgi:hypothetical protein
MTSPLLTSPADLTYEFPPALARIVRERLTRRSGCLSDVSDDVFARLLTTIFFAGLDTYEGEHHPIGVAFLGRSSADFVISESAAAGSLPLYQWKIRRFASPRPLATPELVKLGVGGLERRIYSAVGVLDDGRLAITGLAREGFNGGPDPFVKIIASRPGCLSIRSGRDLVIEYDRGSILTFSEDERFSTGPRRALEAIARGAGVDDDVVPHYLDAVASLVHEIVSHGRGGILIISAEELTSVAESVPYGMIPDSSLATLLRLAWRAGQSSRAATPENRAFGQLLRNAFLTEAERVVEEFGRLTAIEGAVLLNRDLALVAFGLLLPVGGQIPVTEGTPPDDGSGQIIDFGSRGTRHRASATYAWEHPGSVVFVASEDGQVSCMLRARVDEPVVRWRLAVGRLTSRYLSR